MANQRGICMCCGQILLTTSGNISVHPEVEFCYIQSGHGQFQPYVYPKGTRRGHTYCRPRFTTIAIDKKHHHPNTPTGGLNI